MKRNGTKGERGERGKQKRYNLYFKCFLGGAAKKTHLANTFKEQKKIQACKNQQL